MFFAHDMVVKVCALISSLSFLFALPLLSLLPAFAISTFNLRSFADRDAARGLTSPFYLTYGPLLNPCPSAVIPVVISLAFVMQAG